MAGERTEIKSWIACLFDVVVLPLASVLLPFEFLPIYHQANFQNLQNSELQTVWGLAPLGACFFLSPDAFLAAAKTVALVWNSAA